jgi:hypothetical protein
MSCSCSTWRMYLVEFSMKCWELESCEVLERAWFGSSSTKPDLQAAEVGVRRTHSFDLASVAFYLNC